MKTVCRLHNQRLNSYFDQTQISQHNIIWLLLVNKANKEKHLNTAHYLNSFQHFKWIIVIHNLKVVSILWKKNTHCIYIQLHSKLASFLE